MRRTQVQFDEVTYQALKREASTRGISMSEVLRALVRDHVCELPQRRACYEDFTFIASGVSDRPDLEPLSERHDDALADDAKSASW